jgi:hypothetical protein
MSLENEGYLSENMASIKLDIQNKSSTLFNAYLEFNLTLHQIKNLLKVRPTHELQDSLIIPMFIRSIQSFSSIKFLAEHLLTYDAAIVCRALIETVFFIKYCSLHENNAIEYLLVDSHEAKKIINRTNNGNSKTLAKIFEGQQEKLKRREEELNSIINELTPNKKSCMEPKRLTCEIAANKSDLSELYDREYSILCKYTHVSATSISEMCTFDEEFRITQISLFPNDDDLHTSILRSSLKSIAIIINVVEKHFSIEIPNEKHLQKLLNSL